MCCLCVSSGLCAQHSPDHENVVWAIYCVALRVSFEDALHFELVVRASVTFAGDKSLPKSSAAGAGGGLINALIHNALASVSYAAVGCPQTGLRQGQRCEDMRARRAGAGAGASVAATPTLSRGTFKCLKLIPLSRNGCERASGYQ